VTGRLDARARVRASFEHAKVSPLAARRCLERRREAAPDVHARLARDAVLRAPLLQPGEDRGVEIIADVLDVVSRDGDHRLRPDAWRDPLLPARALRDDVGAADLDLILVVALVE